MDEQLVKQLSQNIVELTYQIQVLVSTIEQTNKMFDNVVYGGESLKIVAQ